ncbi:MAG: NUDIX hydrolase [Opitutales bacterium]|nr:NUDIX hydrolase [Opitutales bacterium]NRA26208.1 NUDIX hydrolase [Opitutales bacterium]
MHRTHIIQLLEAYEPFRDEDRESCQRTLEFVKATPDCFERTTLPGHITGSCWLLDPSHQHILLTHHRKLDKWLQLGGHVDGESDVMEAALREAYEESGLQEIQPLDAAIYDIDIHNFPEKGAMPAHLHFDIRFAFEAIGSTAFSVSEESLDLRWVPIAKVSEMNADQSVVRMADKWMARPTHA